MEWQKEEGVERTQDPPVSYELHVLLRAIHLRLAYPAMHRGTLRFNLACLPLDP